jgi:hypothetical protein
MNLDRQTVLRLRPPSSTQRVMTRAQMNGRSNWSLRVKGKIVTVGDRLEAIRLYDKAVVLGAAPILMHNGCVRDRSKFD